MAVSISRVAILELLDFLDNRLDSFDCFDLIKRILDYIEHYAPECVYVHYGCDLNADHRRLHGAVVSECRPTPELHHFLGRCSLAPGRIKLLSNRGSWLNAVLQDLIKFIVAARA